MGDSIQNDLIEEDKLLWAAADMNGDNKLDSKEFAAFVNPEEFVRMHSTLVKQMLARKDHNKDGFINFNEFITDEYGNTPEAKSTHFISEKDKFENEFDLNHDGRLDFDECMKWIIPNNR